MTEVSDAEVDLMTGTIKEAVIACLAVIAHAAEQHPLNGYAVRLSILDVVSARVLDDAIAAGNDRHKVMRRHEHHVRSLMRSAL